MKTLGFLVGIAAFLFSFGSAAASPVGASSASGACPSGKVGSRGECVVQIDRNTTCAWPVKVNGRVVAFCLRKGVDQ